MPRLPRKRPNQKEAPDNARLQQLIQQVNDEIGRADRVYALGNDKIVIIRLGVFLDVEDQRRHHWRLSMSVTDQQGYASYGYDILELTPRELVQLAEYRGVVENWLNGVMEDLPPSTAEIKRRED